MVSASSHRRPATGDRRPATVLAVARNLVSAIRLLEVMPVFVDDPRVRIHWTIAPGSAYAAATDEYLARLGVRLIPWEEACAARYGLVVATSGNGELFRLTGPLLLLPHGAGFSKVVAAGQAAPAGLAPSQLVHDGRVIPRVVGLEHEDQHARLAAYCPEAADRGVVLGDPTRDRMSLGARLRGIYRQALAVPDQCALVVLSSTWGPGSLLDAVPDLPGRLAAALPFDEFRLAAVVHPNAAASLGAWEVGRLLSRSRAAGLHLIPPDRWEGAILAADLVIGDQGSVSLYAAAAGTRVVLGAYDGDQIVDDSPMAALAAHIPRLDPSSDLNIQIRSGLAQDVRGQAYTQASEGNGVRGRSLDVTQRVAYELLGLPRPTRLPSVRAPEPLESRQTACTAHLVLVTRAADADVDLELRRFAPGIDPDLLTGYEAEEVCRHLAVSDSELDMSVRGNAEVLVLKPDAEVPETRNGALEAHLVREGGCLRVIGQAVGKGRCLAAVLGLGMLGLEADERELDAAVLPSVFLAVISQEHGDGAAALKRLRAGVSVRIGAIETTVTAYEPASVHPSSPSPL